MAVGRPVPGEPRGIELLLFAFRRYTCRRVLLANLDLKPPAVRRFSRFS